jgi:hypothetical protein
MQPRCRQRLVELRAIRALAGFGFGEVGDDLAAIQIGGHRRALRFDAESGLALPISADPEVRDVLALRCHCLPLFQNYQRPLTVTSHVVSAASTAAFWATSSTLRQMRAFLNGGSACDRRQI